MNIEISVLNKKFRVENFVAVALIEQFAIRFPENKAYVHEKVEKIKNLDTFNCILYWFNLDEDGRQVFADRLRIPPEMLSDTAKGLKFIFNGGF